MTQDLPSPFPADTLLDTLENAISLLALSEASPDRLPTVVTHLLTLGQWMVQHGGSHWTEAGRVLERHAERLSRPAPSLEQRTTRQELLALLKGWYAQLTPSPSARPVWSIAPAGMPSDGQRDAAVQRLVLDEHAIVSVTDHRGVITEVNDRFCHISGYRRDELLGRTHSLLRSGRHPDSFYRDMWGTIVRGQVWQGVLCNRSKDGGYYWVKSTIVPVRDATGTMAEFISVRTDVTALKEIEERLHLLDRAAQGSRTGMLVVDLCHPDTPVVWSNEAAHQLTADDAPVDGPAEASSALLRRLRLQIQARELDGAPFPVHTESGRVYELRLSPIHDDQGVPTHGLVLVEDITDSQRQREALHRTQARLLQAQRMARLAHWSYDAHCQRLAGSEVLAGLLGLSDPHASADLATLYRHVLPEDRFTVLRSLATLRRSGSAAISFRYQAPHQALRHLHATATAEVLPHQPRRWIGTLQDLTPLRQAEERVRQLAQVFDHTDRGVCISDLDGTILHANRAASQALGLPVAQLLSRRLEEFIAPSQREEATRQWQHLARHGGHWSGLLRAQRLDGQAFDIRHETGLITAPQGQARYYYHLFQDCAQELRHHEELLEAKLAAERANEAKTVFLSRVSHELRTPLNAILGFAQLMELDLPNTTPHGQYVREIVTAGRHLHALINDVLDLSSIESGQVKVSRQPLALPDLLSECLSLVRPLAQARQIRLQPACEVPPTLFADRTRLKQVLINLLSNAIKYGRAGGMVQLETWTTPPSVRIAVTDDGPGIPSEYRERLFRPFSRLHLETRPVEGHGMGLAISRRLVEAMQGQIGLEDNPAGSGCRFWLELPSQPLAT